MVKAVADNILVGFTDRDVQEANIIVQRITPRQTSSEIQTASRTLIRLHKAVRAARNLTVIALSTMVVWNIVLIVILTALYHNKLYFSNFMRINAHNVTGSDDGRIAQLRLMQPRTLSSSNLTNHD